MQSIGMSKRTLMTWRRLGPALALLLLAGPVAAMNFVVELGQAELQRKVERIFPFTQEDQLYRVELDRPQVVLRDNSDRIGLRLNVAGMVMQQLSLTGRALVDGRLRFDAPNRAFYLDDATLTELQIDGVPASYSDEIRRIAEQMARDILSRQPVYVLDKDDALNKRLGGEIKAVNVRNGKLVVELAMF